MNRLLAYTFLTILLLLCGSCQEDDYVYPDVLTELAEAQTNGKDWKG